MRAFVVLLLVALAVQCSAVRLNFRSRSLSPEIDAQRELQSLHGQLANVNSELKQVDQEADADFDKYLKAPLSSEESEATENELAAAESEESEVSNEVKTEPDTSSTAATPTPKKEEKSAESEKKKPNEEKLKENELRAEDSARVSPLAADTFVDNGNDKQKQPTANRYAGMVWNMQNVIRAQPKHGDFNHEFSAAETRQVFEKLNDGVEIKKVVGPTEFNVDPSQQETSPATTITHPRIVPEDSTKEQKQEGSKTEEAKKTEENKRVASAPAAQDALKNKKEESKAPQLKNSAAPKLQQSSEKQAAAAAAATPLKNQKESKPTASTPSASVASSLSVPNLAEDKKLSETNGKQASAPKQTSQAAAMPQQADSKKEAAAAAPQKTETKKEATAVAPQKTENKKETTAVAPQKTENKKDAAASAPQKTENKKETAAVAPQKTENKKEPATVAPQKTENKKETAAVTPQQTESKSPAAAAPPQKTEVKKETAAVALGKTENKKEAAASAPQKTEQAPAQSNSLLSQIAPALAAFQAEKSTDKKDSNQKDSQLAAEKENQKTTAPQTVAAASALPDNKPAAQASPAASSPAADAGRMPTHPVNQDTKLSETTSD